MYASLGLNYLSDITVHAYMPSTMPMDRNAAGQANDVEMMLRNFKDYIRERDTLQLIFIGQRSFPPLHNHSILPTVTGCNHAADIMHVDNITNQHFSCQLIRKLLNGFLLFTTHSLTTYIYILQQRSC